MAIEFPSPEDAAALPLDQLALHLLAYLRDQSRSGASLNHRSIVNKSVWSEHATSDLIGFLRLLQEAWDWLYARGLISGAEPEQLSTAGWPAFITRRGFAVLDEPNGLERLAAELRLDVALHERIRGRVRPQFLLGDYELAAIAALREVEIRVRELSKLSNSLVGTKLMTEAFPIAL